MAQQHQFTPIEGSFKDTRSDFQEGTWIEIRYPYAIIMRARVLCSNGQKKVTKRVGHLLPGSLNERIASVQYGNGRTVTGTISIRTLNGEPTGDNSKGIVMFKANPNGVRAARYPSGWYDEQHG